MVIESIDELFLDYERNHSFYQVDEPVSVHDHQDHGEDE